MSIKKTIGWTFAGLGILLIVIIVAAFLYLRTNSFRRFAIREIVKQADQATGGRTEIGGLDFKLSTLTAHLYNITVRGTEGQDSRRYCMPTNSLFEQRSFPYFIIRFLCGSF